MQPGENAMRNYLSGLVGALCLFVAGADSRAQEYPARPIKIVAAAGAGSGIDVTFRTMSDELGRILGQAITIENKPGANGLIAIQDVLRARADGYTLLGGNINTNTLMPVVDAKKLSFDMGTSLIPILYVNHVPAVLIAAQSVPGTVAGFVEHAKANPGKLNYGITGVGAYNHMDMLLLAKVTGIKMEPVVTPTVAAAATSLLNGDVHSIFITAQAALPLVQDGKIRPLAVTGNVRLPELPDVPTMAEAGFAGIGSNVWQGLFAPAGTPQLVVDKIFAAARRALADKAVDEALRKRMFISQPSESPMAFREFLKRDHDKWTAVAVENGLVK